MLGTVLIKLKCMETILLPGGVWSLIDFDCDFNFDVGVSLPDDCSIQLPVLRLHYQRLGKV